MNYDHDDTDGSNSIDYIIERKLQYIIDDAHMNTISKIEFLYGEPILTSCSHDNSIKIWIFDSPDGSARLLRSRQGHCGYPLRIRYYGGITNMSIHTATDAHDCEILSCGTDQTLRLFNSVLENQNREFSQKIILKKYGYQKRHERLPTIIGYDYSEAREKEWGNLVTIHLNHSCAYVWNYKSRTITDLVLKQSEWNTNNMKYVVDSSTHSTAVCLSPCGNYCAIGSKGGIIYLYNIQSGLSRGSFPKIQIMNEKKVNRIKKLSSTPGNVFEIRKQIQEQSKGSEANSLKIKSNSSNEIVTQTPIDDYDGHDQEISGLFIDLSVSVLVTCGKDGQVIFWDFTSHQILTRHTFQTAHTLLQGLHDSNFVAIAGQDRTIRLFDITGKNMIRKFTHVHSREITDLAFSPDGRRLISSSIDKTVRVFDLTSSRCLSWLEFDSPVMSITVSHSGMLRIVSFLTSNILIDVKCYSMFCAILCSALLFLY
jgi:U3 small nucleolar RNA-associated protein 21